MTATTTLRTVTVNVTPAAYDALGLDNPGIMEAVILDGPGVVSFRVLRKGTRYTLTLAAAQELRHALRCSHMVEPEAIRFHGLGEYRAATALLAQVERATAAAEEAQKAADRAAIQEIREAQRAARLASAKLSMTATAADSMVDDLLDGAGDPYGTVAALAGTLGDHHGCSDVMTVLAMRHAEIMGALDDLELDGLGDPNTIYACRVALAYGDLSGLEGCGFDVAR